MKVVAQIVQTPYLTEMELLRLRKALLIRAHPFELVI